MKNSCSKYTKSRRKVTSFTLLCGMILGISLMMQPRVQAQDVQESDQVTHTDSLNTIQLNTFGDFTVEEALTRIPGVHVNRDGDISLRGTGLNNYYTTINGQRLSATSENSRSTDLSTISLDLVQKIEWQKVLTPDMDADGLAGAVHLTTYQPNTEKTTISGSLGGGFNPDYLQSTGATGRTSLRYSGPLSEDLGLTIGVNYQRDQQARESLGMEYSTADFGSGPVDVTETFAPGFQHEGANRFTANFGLKYDPSETSSYYFHGLTTQNQFESALHQNFWSADGDWEDANTVGSGLYGYELNFLDRDVTQYTFQAGGENIFDAFTLDYTAGWSQSTVEQTENLFPFQETGVEYTINTDNKERPVVTPADQVPAPVDMNLDEMNYIIDDYLDQEFSARVNVEVPINLGSLKFGANSILKEQDANNRGAYSNYSYSFLGALNLEGFETGNVESRSVYDGQYELGRIIDSDEALSFFQSSIPNMRRDNSAYYRESEIFNYFAGEDLFGGYGMATLNFEPFKLLLGARAEYTNSDFEGRVVRYNRFGQYQETMDTTASSNELEFFPNAQLAFELSPQTTIKTAYSRTIARPDYNFLAPFELRTPGDTLLFRGNPDLKSIASNNVDVDVDHRFQNGGHVSVAGFYKIVSNLIERTEGTQQIQRGEYPSFDDLIPEGENEFTTDLETYQNSSNDASVYGVEVAFQKQLNFLPGALEHLGTYMNYTWTQSNFESHRGEETSIPGQSPHVVNAALNYSDSKLFAQLSYHWTAELLYELGEDPLQAPSISSNLVFVDRYQDGYEELSATVRYNFSDAVQVWANIYNILGAETIEYAGEEQFYPTSIYQQSGTEFNVGVRLTF